ncbi:MAG: hypothetical protein HY244_18635 [Rhizobiales bacterium]|nr:hypothetical protein [Hyphomicrobiales bacterium]
MKRALMIAVAGAALAATLSLVAADPSRRGLLTQSVGLPAYEIIANVRAHGLAPISELSLRWPYYVLHAYDPRGIEVRVVIDAQFGDILSVTPARPLATAYTPRYERGARIIQVPQPNEQDEPDAYKDDEEVVPPAPRRMMPQPKPRGETTSAPIRRSNAPLPPPVQRRNILSAPPPRVESTLSPQQTARSNPKLEPIERFGAPGGVIISPNTPPPGYTPPAALPLDVTSANSPLPPGNTPTVALPPEP